MFRYCKQDVQNINPNSAVKLKFKDLNAYILPTLFNEVGKDESKDLPNYILILIRS